MAVFIPVTPPLHGPQMMTGLLLMAPGAGRWWMSRSTTWISSVMHGTPGEARTWRGMVWRVVVQSRTYLCSFICNNMKIYYTYTYYIYIHNNIYTYMYAYNNIYAYIICNNVCAHTARCIFCTCNICDTVSICVRIECYAT